MCLGEHRHHLVAFLPAQQAGVDEHAGELSPIARCSSAATTEESTPPDRPRMTSSLPTLRAHAGDLVVDDVGGSPQRAAAADVRHEAAQHQFALNWCG
jgi:hypothetical protein